MRSIAIVCALLALATADLRADGDAQTQDWTSRVVPVKNVQASDTQVFDLLRTLGVKASNPVNGYIALSGPKVAVIAAAEFLDKLDAGERPQPDVDFRGWLLIETAQEASSSLPPDLEPVARQLKAAFGYRNLRLASTFDLRSRVGRDSRTEGQIPVELLGGKSPWAASYVFQFNRLDVAGDGAGPRKLRIDNLNFSCNLPEGHGSLRISTGVDMTEGQKVVIGRTSVVYGTEMPLILVLSARPAVE